MRTVSYALMLATTLGAADVPRAQPCSGTEHRRLDFLVGNWIIRNPSGDATGTVTVSKEYGGCVLIERWSGVGEHSEGLGVAGYRPERRRWHRDLADHAGVVLALDGRWDGGRMVMTGKDYSHPDGTRMHRITWSPRGDGSVEEQWQTSDDAGQSWQLHLDRRFRRIAE
jgi:hypothetical protein